MALHLKKLTTKDQDDYAVYELLQSLPPKEHGFTNKAAGLTFAEFKQWIIEQEKTSRGIDVPADHVPQTYFWLFKEKACIGLGKIRHQLNDKLKNKGGHIGYAIHPNYRGKGHGTQLLKLLLKEAANIGIRSALITCSASNIPSQKVIITNGGVLNSKNSSTHRYLVSTKN